MVFDIKQKVVTALYIFYFAHIAEHRHSLSSNNVDGVPFVDGDYNKNTDTPIGNHPSNNTNSNSSIENMYIFVVVFITLVVLTKSQSKAQSTYTTKVHTAAMHLC